MKDNFLQWVRNYSALILLLVAGFLMSGSLFIRNPNIGGDAIGYLIPVHNLVKGHGYTLNGITNILSSPGFGSVSYLVYLLVGDVEYSAMIVSMSSYLLMIVIAFYIGSAFSGSLAGLFCGLFVTFSPVLLAHSYVSLSDPLYALMMMCSFAYFIQMLARGVTVRRSAIAGALFAFATLVRADSAWIILITVCGLPVWLWWSKAPQKDMSGKKKMLVQLLIPSVVMLISFTLVMFPYAYFLHKHTGVWTVSNKIGFVLMGGTQDTPNLTFADAQNARAYLLDHIGDTLKRLQNNSFMMIHQVVIQNYHAIMSAVLLWLLYPLYGRRTVVDVMRGKKVLIVLLGSMPFLSTLLPSLFIIPYERYIMPYSAVVLVFCGCLCAVLLEGLIGIYAGRWKTAVGVILVVFFSFIFPYMPKPAILQSMPTISSVMKAKHGHFGLRAAGMWMNKNIKDIDSVCLLSRKGLVPLFYASGKNVPRGTCTGNFPETLDGFGSYMNRNKINLLILDNFYAAGMPLLIPLLNHPETAGIYGLQLVHLEEGLYQIYKPVMKEGFQ